MIIDVDQPALQHTLTIIPLLIRERSADHTADRPRCRLLGLPGAQHPPVVAAATVRIPAPLLQRLAPGMLRSPKMCAPLQIAPSSIVMPGGVRLLAMESCFVLSELTGEPKLVGRVGQLMPLVLLMP